MARKKNSGAGESKLPEGLAGIPAPSAPENARLWNGMSDLAQPRMDLVAGFAHDVIRVIASRRADMAAPPVQTDAKDIEAFCEQLIAGKAVYEAEILNDPETSEAPDMDRLAAAARLLGDWWVADKASFLEVTIGMGRIFDILRDAPELAPPATDPNELSVVFCAVPGEQHTLGVRLAAELFRMDGWDVSLRVGLEHDELVSDIARMDRCILGLSIGGSHSLKALGRLVPDLRAKCPKASILVSGQDIEDLRPQLSQMGLDGIAVGLDEAREKMAALWDENTRPAM